MKTIFISAKRKVDINEKKILSLSKNLPKNLAVAYSIQFKELASQIKSILSKKHNITKIVQVLRCSEPIFPKNTDAVLFVGSGKFHGVSLAFSTKIPVYILENDKLVKISDEEIKKLEQREKAGYINFLNSNVIGILISTKPGQENLKKALNFKKTLKGKKPYLFLANNIDHSEFENFHINSWVNTACPRMDMNDTRIINKIKIKK
jgi:diphthamide biosynthesis enzyme Dph1/Dph2-like protein